MPARLAGISLTALGDIIFIPGCLRCRGSSLRRRGGVCLTCWAEVRPLRHPGGPCLECDAAVPGCLHPPPPWSWITAAISYQGAGRDLVRLYKFGPQGGRLGLAWPLAALLATALRAQATALDVDMVVPVPSHRARRRQRGFDAAGALARYVAAAAGLGKPRRLLWRQDRAAPRARTAAPPSPASYRLQQRARHHLLGRRVLLLDDVCTTGTTLRLCSAALLGAGAAEVRGAVLAFTPRRFFAGARSME